MKLNLPRPGSQYSQSDEAQTRHTIEMVDATNMKIAADILVDPTRNKLVIKSPNGNQWSLVVDNTGALSTVAL